MKMKYLTLLLFALFVCGVIGEQTVGVKWKPSPENAYVRSYTLHWGTNSGAYFAKQNVGTNTIAVVTNLLLGAEYFFAATAEGKNGTHSSFSEEVAYLVSEGPSEEVPQFEIVRVPVVTITLEANKDVAESGNWEEVGAWRLLFDSEEYRNGSFRSRVEITREEAVVWK